MENVEGSNIFEQLGKTAVQLFCKQNLEGFNDAADIFGALSRYSEKNGLVTDKVQRFFLLGMVEDLALQHWVDPYKLIANRVYKLSPRLQEQIHGSARDWSAICPIT